MYLGKRGFLFGDGACENPKSGPAERVSACVDKVGHVSEEKEDGALDELLKRVVIDGVGEGKSKGYSDAVCEGRSEGAMYTGPGWVERPRRRAEALGDLAHEQSLEDVVEQGGFAREEHRKRRKKRLLRPESATKRRFVQVDVRYEPERPAYVLPS
jgi:hypothetical protein